METAGDIATAQNGTRDRSKGIAPAVTLLPH